MTYNWYFLTVLQDFIDSGLVSREITLNYPGLGLKTVLITRGSLYSILFEGVLLSIDLNSKNPFEFGGYAVYYDSAGGVWLGIVPS